MAASNARNEGKDKRNDQGTRPRNGSGNGTVNPKETESENKDGANDSSHSRFQHSSRPCFLCDEVGHYKRD